MDRKHYDEMVAALDELESENKLDGKIIFLFGHCNATEELVDLLLSRNYQPVAILDNNKEKHGMKYRGVEVVSPYAVLLEEQKNCLVCIVARAYAAMADQLNRLGFKGQIRKLVDYNSYAEYSLSEKTISSMKKRVKEGERLLLGFSDRYPDTFCFLCPFSALGDIYIMMSYLPTYLKKQGIHRCVIGLVGKACSEVVRLFGSYDVEDFTQEEMDQMIQAALYTRKEKIFIPHQDRPYVVNLPKALYHKKIPLSTMYCCGVFGLPEDTEPVVPLRFKDFPELHKIPAGKAVIISPYAKSVPVLVDEVWRTIVEFYASQGYKCFTNVVDGEEPIEGTEAISPGISEIKSVVERAGTFVGIRSGLCDVLQNAKAEKIALYPDYNYCDTKWKAIEIYELKGWKNRVVKEDFEWERS